jgi:hypothetical protein
MTKIKPFNILFFCDPVTYLEEKTFFSYTSKKFWENIVQPLHKVAPDSRFVVLVGEDVVNITPGDFWEKIIVPEKLMTRPFNGRTLDELNARYINKYDREQNKYYLDMFRNIVPADFTPDILILSTPCPMLEQAFPEAAACAFNTHLDIDGYFGSRAFSDHYDEIFSDYAITPEQERNVRLFKLMKRKQFLNNPHKNWLAPLREKWKRIVLLPLSISGSPMFDAMCKYQTQLEFLEDVMAHVSENTLVIATFHPLTLKHWSFSTVNFLRERYQNLLLDDRLFDFLQASMWVMPYADIVVNSTSYVGVLAKLHWDKKVIGVAPRYYTPLWDSNNLNDIETLLDAPSVKERNIDLHWIQNRQLIHSLLLNNPQDLADYLRNFASAVKNRDYKNLYPPHNYGDLIAKSVANPTALAVFTPVRSESYPWRLVFAKAREVATAEADKVIYQMRVEHANQINNILAGKYFPIRVKVYFAVKSVIGRILTCKVKNIARNILPRQTYDFARNLLRKMGI